MTGTVKDPKYYSLIHSIIFFFSISLFNNATEAIVLKLAQCTIRSTFSYRDVGDAAIATRITYIGTGT